MTMRIKCNRCGESAIITSSSQESDDYKKLYCSCKNYKCGHTFVMDVSFSHTVSPSALDFPDGLIKKICTKTPQEQKKIFANLCLAVN